jgi:peptidoglycan/xylan/chitin deacetylase (PgdA/CDA1 family)
MGNSTNLKVKIPTAVLIILFYFGVTGSTTDWEYGQTTVKKWADGRKSAFTFTFDDGCMSQYTYAVPLLDSFKFKGTFFIVTSLLTEDLPGIEDYGTWKQFESVGLDGHEIGSHTVDHVDLTTLQTGDTLTAGTLLYELYQSKKIIEGKISNQKCISFAYPSLAFDSTVVSKTQMFYEAGRSGGSIPIDSSLTGTQFYTIGAYEEYFNLPRNSVQADQDELVDFENYMQNAITTGRWGMLEAHEVVPFSLLHYMLQQGAWYPMTTEWLTSVCQWLKQRSDSNDVWIETIGNITKYMKERESFQYDILMQTSTIVKLNVTDTLTNPIYNYPLTIDVTVPPDWKAAIIDQGTNKDTAYTFISGSDNIIRTYVIPNSGLLILNKADIALPVELTTFTATIADKGIKLSWSTSTEINTNQFVIERMRDNKSWERIGSVQGSGNSNSTKAYSFIDNSSKSNGKYSYRLKMIDNDGKFKYSDVVNVVVNTVPEIYSLEQNYPNPFNPNTKIRYTLSSMGHVTVKVYDIIGNEIATLINEEKPTGSYELTWNAGNIPSGVYYYRMQAGSFTETKKMILLK